MNYIARRNFFGEPVERRVRGLSDFFNEIEKQMFDSLPSVFTDREGIFEMKTDIVRTDKETIITMDMPGFRQDDIDISIEDNVLTVKGERISEKEENQQDYSLRERHVGVFKRSFTIPSGIDEKDISANYKDGVLKLVLPNPKDSVRKKISISSE